MPAAATDQLATMLTRVVREELARVGLVPPNPHVEPGVYRVQADGTWWRVPERVEGAADAGVS